MPRVESHVARTDLYNRGARVPSDKTKSGFRIDRSKPADEKDELFCKKGDRYYTWSLMMGSRGVDYRSLTPPKRSQLTMSEFLGAMYDLEDDVNWSSAESPEDLQQMRDDLASELRSLGRRTDFEAGQHA